MRRGAHKRASADAPTAPRGRGPTLAPPTSSPPPAASPPAKPPSAHGTRSGDEAEAGSFFRKRPDLATSPELATGCGGLATGMPRTRDGDAAGLTRSEARAHHAAGPEHVTVECHTALPSRSKRRAGAPRHPAAAPRHRRRCARGRCVPVRCHGEPPGRQPVGIHLDLERSGDGVVRDAMAGGIHVRVPAGWQRRRLR